MADLFDKQQLQEMMKEQVKQINQLKDQLYVAKQRNNKDYCFTQATVKLISRKLAKEKENTYIIQALVTELVNCNDEKREDDYINMIDKIINIGRTKELKWKLEKIIDKWD